MTADVYFSDFRARSRDENRGMKIQRLFDTAFGDVFSEDDVVAVKVHFGERGNDSFVSPVLVRYIVEKIRESGASVFLTDTNTLYYGSRHNSVHHLETAILNGFDYAVSGAPIIIADGLHGKNQRTVRVDGKHFSEVKIAGDIHDASGMVVVSHFKGHGMSGFGGALKNLAMGCATIEGKMEQHECAKPIIRGDCTSCGACIMECPVDAVCLEDGVRIDYERCIACMNCLDTCENQVFDLDWEKDIPEFIERMMEYAMGAAALKGDRICYMNFLMNITPDCDCVPWSDQSIVPDIGILASRDPVAIDTASYNLVNQQPGHRNSLLEKNHGVGEDKFRGVWGDVDGTLQLRYAEGLGLGVMDYRLIRV
ncbi:MULTISPECIES: DUF362 domain-containing protein [Methanothermobacter]|uniref:DUF362 domain-containing protein n=1 Tax=Methanothermobacter wolfeii TaxID=145261 RepID=A0A9E7RX71_METWO|nr:DUF362 domain-containing protein [Methanothermobacter wolfeii]UXH32069.1 DUF362 domain-containing protein [Methanothermobacter wolfeii]